MIPRELLDTDDWYISINWLGIGALYATSPKTGITVKATSDEKSYLVRMMETLQRAGVPLRGNQPVLAAIYADFAQAIHHRPKPDSFIGGGYYWRFFEMFAPDVAAQHYLSNPNPKPLG